MHKLLVHVLNFEALELHIYNKMIMLIAVISKSLSI